jgi:S1-C subfamily serine protease
MKARYIFLALAIIVACCGSSLEESPMFSNYCEIITLDDDGMVKNRGTGLAFTPSRCLINFHSIEAGQYIGIQDEKSSLVVIGNIVYADPHEDLVVVDFAKNLFAPKNVKEAKGFSVGDTALCYANTLGLGKVFHKVVISKITENRILFHPTLGKGASGAGLWSEKGELIGIAQGTYFLADVPGAVGFAIPADRAIAVIKQHNSPEVKRASGKETFVEESAPPARKR